MSKRILIVDDDPNITSYLSDFLGEEGYKTLIANNGKEAERICSTQDIDLITLDLEMPEMHGPRFNLHLKRNGKAIPIIVITGQPELKPAIPNAVAKFDKPFKREDVLAKVREILGA
jgi:DNA-binding response OmpR family regulator